MRYAVLLGIGMAILANSRPFEGLVFSIPIFIWLLWWLLRNKEVPLQAKLRKIVLPLSIVLALAGIWIGYYNWRVTGNPLLFPYVLNQRAYDTEPVFLWQSAQPKHARLQPGRDQCLHERLPALVILPRHRHVHGARQLQQRRRVRGQVRRAVGVGHARFQRRA